MTTIPGFIPIAEIKVGDETSGGLVTGTRTSRSGRTVYLTVRGPRGGEHEQPGADVRSAGAVFSRGTCVYRDVPGDPAIRVCATHDPEFGLYGDEFCARKGGS